MDRIDLTSNQSDFAIFLPAISTFYATFIGNQRKDPNYIPQSRLPAGFTKDVEGLNYLDNSNGYFNYRWSLYSAGHATLDLNKPAPREDMLRNRNRSNSFLLGDSGGFQIGKGLWEGDWKDPNCPRATKKRAEVLSWLDGIADYGMCLDVPAWVALSQKGREKTGVNSYAEAAAATRNNNEYFIRNRNGNCKFLNVMQGENHTEADDWYNRMKDFCDPKAYPGEHFNGWALGGQNTADIHLALRRIVQIMHDGLLEKGKHDWMHFLGTSKLEWTLLLTDIQRGVRKHHNENFTISFDCASPFLATANGQIYTDIDLQDGKKWVYRMLPSVDNKKYATDNRKFSDALLQDGIFKKFEDSPISELMQIKDVCVYKPGDLNKIGKEGKTSWDSFSYALQMGHNVWMHIQAVQRANYEKDNGIWPAMLVRDMDKQTSTDIISEIFAAGSYSRSMELIDEHNRFWLQIVGRGGANSNTGKKATNAKTMFAQLFEVTEPVVEEHDDEFNDTEIDNLEKLEENEENDPLG